MAVVMGKPSRGSSEAEGKLYIPKAQPEDILKVIYLFLSFNLAKALYYQRYFQQTYLSIYSKSLGIWD